GSEDAAGGGGGLAGAGRPHDQRTGAGYQPTAQQGVQFGDASADGDRREPAAVLGGDEARVDREAARLDGVVVVAAAEPDTAHLHHAQGSSFRAVPAAALLQRDHAVGDAVQLQVARLGGLVV